MVCGACIKCFCFFSCVHSHVTLSLYCDVPWRRGGSGAPCWTTFDAVLTALMPRQAAWRISYFMRGGCCFWFDVVPQRHIFQAVFPQQRIPCYRRVRHLTVYTWPLPSAPVYNLPHRICRAAVLPVSSTFIRSSDLVISLSISSSQNPHSHRLRVPTAFRSLVYSCGGRLND